MQINFNAMDIDPEFWEDKLVNLVSRFEKMLKSNREEYFNADDFIDIIDTYVGRNKFDYAEKAVDIALKFHPLSVDILTLKAEIHINKIELNKALKVLKFAQTIDNGSIDLILTWGFYYHKCRQNQKAKMFFERAIKNSTGDELKDTLLFIARFYSDEKESQQSIEYFKRLYDIDPDNLDVIFELAKYYAELGDSQSALKMLEAGLDIDPFDFVFWRLKGDIHKSINEYTEAIDAYENSLAIFPGNYLSCHGLSNLYFSQKEYKKSIEANNLYTDDIYEDEYNYYNNACCYYEMGQYDQAIKNYTQSINIDPNPEPYLTWFGLGKAYYKLGNFLESYKYFQKTLKKNPEQENAWMYLGLTQLELGFFNHAILSFERALSSTPENIDIWKIYFKSVYYHLTIEKAFDVICNIISKNPGNSESLLYKSACLIELGQITEAEQVLKIALTQNAPLDEFITFYPKILNLENFALIINKLC